MIESPALYRKQSSENLFSPLERVFEAAECHTQAELAEFFGIRQSSISDAKNRRAIPTEWLVKLLRHKSINPEWILLGAEPKHLGPATGEPPTRIIYLTEIRPPKECSVQELVVELARRALIDL
jgi:hypothetical protein